MRSQFVLQFVHLSLVLILILKDVEYLKSIIQEELQFYPLSSKHSLSKFLNASTLICMTHR